MDLEILKIASNTDNNKILKNQTHNSKLKNPICGDEMQVSVKVVKDNIVDFGYQCKSCVYCQASVSLLSRKAKSKSIEKVKNFAEQAKSCFEKSAKSFDKEWKEFDKIMTKNNISRKECLLLPLNTTLDALNKKTL